MDERLCPYCHVPMDEGSMSFSSSPAGYVSNKQTGMLKSNASIRFALACVECGYVEMYVDPERLRKNLS